MIDAGELGAWLHEVRVAIRGQGATDVPCGSCSACCESSQFIHIAPDETDALAHIPRDLLFPAPGLPRGHVLLGYDEHGRCPMLGAAGCTIHPHRPRTCRVYDCRVLAVAGLSTGEPGKAAIDARVVEWRFGVADEAARVAGAAVAAAAGFLDRHRGDLDGVPVTATQLAVAAVALHDLFLDSTTGPPVLVEPPVEAVAVELRRRRS